jgi:hypothetical protein
MKILKMDGNEYLSLTISLMAGFYSKQGYWFLAPDGILDNYDVETYEDHFEDN